MSTLAGLVKNNSGLNELKSRILFLLMGILVFRIGAHIPVPGLDPERLAHFFHQQQGTILGFFNMFSGGAFSRLTVFAIGIMPYISASIIVQLFTTVSPTLEELKKSGEAGRRKLNQYTRFGTLGLAIIQSMGLAKFLATQSIPWHSGLGFYFTTAVTLVTGTMFLMWLGEQITERGIGNGISIIIFAGIVSRFLPELGQLFMRVREGQLQGFSLIMILALIVATTLLIVFFERAQRRITVNYAQRTQGRKIYAAQSSHLPLKINMAGVIPPIFASAIILLPSTLARWLGNTDGFHWLGELGLALGYGQPLQMVLFAAAIIFFAFFYTALMFNPKETADNLKKSGAFVPGIRPGEQTAGFIDKVMTRLTFIGSLYLVFVCLVPEVLYTTWNVPYNLGGTSLLIAVVVVMDTMAQIQAHMMSHQYESLMKKSNKRGKQQHSGMGFIR